MLPIIYSKFVMKNRITFFLTKLKNHRKVTTVLIILFMYLFIWMFFGFLYFKIANSDKSAFNFDNGIKQYYDTETINLQAKEFINKINASQKNFNITKYDNKAVMDLIKNNDLNTPIHHSGIFLYHLLDLTKPQSTF